MSAPDAPGRPSGSTPPRCAIVLLAAGGSTRLGRAKQLVPYRGATLLRHAAGTALASRVGPVVAVLGADAEACTADLADLPVAIEVNPQWAEGMGGSLRAGVAAVERRHPGVGSVLVMTVDQPRVGPGVLRALAEAVVGGSTGIAAAGYRGAAGVPAAFARGHFPALLEMGGDHGARPLLLRYAGSMVVVPCEEAAFDIDTPADIAASDTPENRDEARESDQSGPPARNPS